MELALLVFNILATACSVAAAVVATLAARRSRGTALEGDLNELSGLVEKLARDTRREKMRSVRSSTAGDVPGGPQLPTDLGPGGMGLGLNGSTTAPPTRKDMLRKRLATRTPA